MEQRTSGIVATVALATLTACGTAPPIPKMVTHTRCHVWSGGDWAYAAARVDDQAHLYTSFGEVDAASFVSNRELRWESTFSTAEGTFSNGELVIHGALGDVGPISIEDNVAVLEGWMSDLVFQYNDACSDDQAAMGVMSLTIAILRSRQ